VDLDSGNVDAPASQVGGEGVGRQVTGIHASGRSSKLATLEATPQHRKLQLVIWTPTTHETRLARWSQCEVLRVVSRSEEPLCLSTSVSRKRRRGCISTASRHYFRNRVDTSMTSMTILKKDLRKRIKEILADVSDATVAAQSGFAQTTSHMQQSRSGLLTMASVQCYEDIVVSARI
jgi:hypothetical protein